MAADDWRDLVEEGYGLLGAERWEEALDRFEKGLADLGPCDTVTHSDHIAFDRAFPRFTEDRSRCLWRCAGILGELLDGLTPDNAVSSERAAEAASRLRAGPRSPRVARALLDWSLAMASSEPGQFAGLVRPFLARAPGLTVEAARRFLTKLKARLP